MTKMLRPYQVWQPTLGAPFGNRNARRLGPHDAESRHLRRRIAALKRNAKVLISKAREETKGAPHQ